jgi:hypothetical protein
MYNVNLIFHGVFAIVLDDEKINVRFPYFYPHEYLLGCWNNLAPMPKGTLHLAGVNGIDGCTPDPNFSEDYSPTVAGAGLTEHCDTNLFCCLKLKEYPLGVYPFREYPLPPAPDDCEAPLAHFPFKGVHGSMMTPTTMAGPIVFRYQTDDLDEVQLMYRGKPLAFTRVIDDPQTLNLHFFAEGEKDLPGDDDPDRPYQVAIHYQAAWDQLASLISTLDAGIDKMWPFVKGHTTAPPPHTGVPGLPGGQLWDLDELFLAAHTSVPPAGGGDTDCDKAHIVIDNRS